MKVYVRILGIRENEHFGDVACKVDEEEIEIPDPLPTTTTEETTTTTEPIKKDNATFESGKNFKAHLESIYAEYPNKTFGSFIRSDSLPENLTTYNVAVALLPPDVVAVIVTVPAFNYQVGYTRMVQIFIILVKQPKTYS